MSTQSTEILAHKEELSYTGDKFKADGAYGATDGLHTVSWKFNEFKGRFWIECSLATTPTDSDWFAIPIGSGTDYKEYTSQTTITEANTFTVNAVWVRARVYRSAITPAPGSYSQATLGSVDTVLLNH